MTLKKNGHFGRTVNLGQERSIWPKRTVNLVLRTVIMVQKNGHYGRTVIMVHIFENGHYGKNGHYGIHSLTFHKSYLSTQDRDFQIHAGRMWTGLFSKSDQELSIDIYIVWFGGRKPCMASRRKFLTKNQIFFIFSSFKPPGGYITIFNQIVTSNRICLFE